MSDRRTDYEVIVIGAGHAGCEAALAAARMGCRTAVVTLNLERIGHLPCNCSIGGPAKGHLAREVDALGGEMGCNTDKTLTHIRYVGTGKGPAVQTLRAHADKDLYPREMRAMLEAAPNLTLLEIGVDDLLVEGSERNEQEHRSSAEEADDHSLSLPPYILLPTPYTLRKVRGARLADGREIAAKAVVVTTGTFLNGLM